MAKKSRSYSRRAVLLRVMRYIRPHLPALLLSLLMTIVSVALTLYIPILVGRAVDCIVAPGQVDFAALRDTLFTMAVCILVTAGAQWAQSILNNRVTYASVRDIRRDAFAHIH